MTNLERIREWWHFLWQYLVSFFYQKEVSIFKYLQFTAHVQTILTYHAQLSITIVGLQNSGKTTLTTVLSGKRFEQDTIPTLGIRLEQFYLGKNAVKIYDLAGQQRFYDLWPRYFEKADLIIYMLDLSDLTTWSQAKHKLHEVIRTTNDQRIPILILGNKTDLVATPDPTTQNPKNKNKKKKTPEEENVEQWKYMAPLLRDYEYEDIPKYQLDGNNLYVLKNIQVLSREIGLDLKNGMLHANADTEPEPQTCANLRLDRDVGIFTISCKDGEYIQDILEWIVQL